MVTNNIINTSKPVPVASGGTGASTLTGIVIGHGTSAMTGNAVTQHDVLVGGASNAITSIAPSATSGVPLISQGAAADPIFGTVGIAGGGTNATSFATTNGVVKYDGTRLVTSSALTLSAANVLQNTAQPCFFVYLNTTSSNVTGDGTTYPVLYDTVLFDQASNITLNSAGKTIFTAPVTGKYLFNVTWNLVWNYGAGDQNVITTFVPSSGNIYRTAEWASQLTSVGSTFQGQSNTVILPLTASETVYFQVFLNGASAKNGTLRGLAIASTIQLNYWSGYLLC